MKYLSDYMQEAQTALFAKTGTFFAFNAQQIREGKKEGIEYICLDGGAMCPKQNVDELLQGLETIYNESIKKDVQENGAEAIIQRQYFNYESQISSTREAYNSLLSYQSAFPELFTNEAIKKGFSNAYELAVKNDWF
jgi:hypothetical protein